MYLYGAGGHAKVVLDVLQSSGVEVLGLFEDTGTVSSLAGIPVYPGIKLSGKPLPLLKAPLIICIGDNRQRATFSTALKHRFGTARHCSAIISDTASIGAGSVMLHQAIVQPDCVIGKHVIINTGACVDYECIIGDFVHISPNAALCRKVYVGEGAHIGAGATVLPGIKVGKWTVIGAGAVVTRDVPDYTVAVGNPARLLSKK